LKYPFPRPPAKTCAFSTKFLVFKLLAIFSASAADLATPNLEKILQIYNLYDQFNWLIATNATAYFLMS
jgi:hypothetical protein